MGEDLTTDVRQLAHDLRNHLFLIALNLQALERDPDPERLAVIVGQIRAELAAGEKIASALEDAAPDSLEP
jgi:hypothetical protein